MAQLKSTTISGNLSVSGTISGNASSATKLQNTRSINGTNFDGSGNITTANWGTARNLTIGNTGKSVNGSANVSWSLSEIGAAASSHTHNYAGSSSAGGNANAAVKLATARKIGSANFDGTGNIDVANILGQSYGTPTKTDANKYQKIARINVGTTTWASYSGTLYIADTESYGFSGILMINIKTTDEVSSQTGSLNWISLNSVSYIDKIYLTKVSDGVFDLYIKIPFTYVSIRYHFIDFAGHGRLTSVSRQPLIDSISSILYTSSFPNNASKLQTARTINGTNFDGTANITTANWGTARNLQIGNTAKSVNGSGNVSWSLSEIGAAASNHTHNYAGSSSAGGNANAAVKLATARTINGTSFDGTGNITTANWGTARNLTIGNTAKSVNGSANVSWSLSEIGAAASSHTHNTLEQKGIHTINSTTDDTVANWGKQKISVHYYSSTGKLIDQPSQYGFLLNMSSGSAEVHQLWMEQASGALRHRGGNASGWSGSWKTVLDSSNYNSYAPTKTGGGASGNWSISVTGNAASATKLQTARTINGTSFDGSSNITTANWGTARTITIGKTGKSVNGSGNVSYSLSEIGALEAGKTAIGNSEFTSSSRSVTVNLGLTMPNATYHVTITPTSNPNGGLGEVYVSSRTTTQFVVTTSGSANFTFSWMAISK